MLTLHFLDASERLRTVRAVHRRLKPGGPFIVAHGSFPQASGARSRWLARYEAYAVAAGADPESAKGARAAVDASLSVLEPDRDEAILREGGFGEVELFFAAFTWRGWSARA